MMDYFDEFPMASLKASYTQAVAGAHASLCIRRTGELWKNGWTDRHAVWGGRLVWAEEPRNHAYGRHLSNTIEWSMHCGDAGYR